MANFAKAQLLKYGWKEGKGLGKNENGLTEALKPTLKFDHAGIGYNETNTEQWWETLYDNAAKNIKVDLHNNKVSLSTINDLNIDNWNIVSSKKNRKTKQQKYGNFLKTSTLHNGHLIQDTSMEKEEKTAKDSVSISLTDEQLYKAYDDRTAHKTARHAHHTLNGKLARIAQQDRIFLDVSSVSQPDTNLIKENTMTHRKTHAEVDTEESEDSEENQEMVDDQNTSQYETNNPVFRSKSARKNQKKRLNKFTQQFSICSLKGNTNSKYNSPHDEETRKRTFKKEKELDIKSGKCTKKRKNKRKKSYERHFEEIQCNSYDILDKTFDIQDKLKDTEDVYSKSKKSSLQQKMYICQSQRSPVISSLNNVNNKTDKDIYQIMLSTERRNMNIEQEIQEQKTKWKYYDGKGDFNPPIKKFYSLHNKHSLNTSSRISFYKSFSTSSFEGQLHINNSDNKLHSKNKQINKKNRQKRVKKLEKVINPVNFCTDDLNNVIKKLTAFDLAEEVSANAFKKKLTQTHLTPV